MLTELRQPLHFDTPKGKGFALLVLDYGPESDLMWVVALDASGEIWTFGNRDVRLRPNETMSAPRAAGTPLGVEPFIYCIHCDKTRTQKQHLVECPDEHCPRNPRRYGS